MRKTSELLRLAKSDPQYLVMFEYLCSVAIWLLRSKAITEQEFTALTEAIRDSLDGHTFLRTYLRNNGIIDHLDDERTPGYSEHAHLHWDTLIKAYEAEGN
jgi:hypothetical protein